MRYNQLYTIFIALICVAMLASCRGSSKKSATTTQTQQGVAEAPHDHDHDHSAETDGHSHDGVPCTGHDHDGEAGHDHDAEAGGHSHDGVPCTGHDNSDMGDEDEIIFPLNQQKTTDFKVERVEAGNFCDVIRAGGEILPAQGSHSSIVAPASGIISFAGGALAEGGAVGSSQRLFYISSSKVGGGDVLLRNKANYEKAKADYERAEKLIKDRIISQREFDEYRLTYQQAKIEYEALSGGEPSKGVAVTSPIGGYITSLNVIAGDYVEVGQVLGSVSQDGRLILRAEVSLKYIPRLDRVTGANFITSYDNKTYQLKEMGGRLISISRSIPEGSALMPITFQFNNVGGVIPGSYVEVRLLGREQSGVITLPLSAVTEQQGIFYIYVQLDEEGFVRREVKLGADDGVRIKIESGLKVGERVVTRGAINVKMASISDAIPHSHEH